ncbi:Phosphatidylinositol transfer protein alpha isoform [Orchesella cincta]|uniref:Phosphatidylinositol transfer protein alpha isoform n=1 Tax=Orchesella cincta TaxID=48709 RepID=A0A1D2MC36_ORCCI|nr:Phosphatidylinositol transfer protein alpha isoform [Orchesella cincta]
MIIKEFRVVMPLSVEEYQVGQLYSLAWRSIVKNEPFDNLPLLGEKYSEGQYTYKKYHLASKVPSFIRMLAPKGSMEIHEEAWNAYPYCRTVVTNPGYMKENFIIKIESLHLADKGTMENVHELTPEKLKLREVVMIDVANDAVASSDYKTSEDPCKFQSDKSGRGPLEGLKWQDQVEPVMTCYKLVTVEFKWLGLQTRGESFIQRLSGGYSPTSTGMPKFLSCFIQLIIITYIIMICRQVFCWIDKWFDMTMEDIRELEDKVREELDNQRTKGKVKGMRVDMD